MTFFVEVLYNEPIFLTGALMFLKAAKVKRKEYIRIVITFKNTEFMGVLSDKMVRQRGLEPEKALNKRQLLVVCSF